MPCNPGPCSIKGSFYYGSVCLYSPWTALKSSPGSLKRQPSRVNGLFPSSIIPTVTLITGITHSYPHHHWHHPLLPLQNVNLPNLPKSQTKNPQESPGPSEKPGSIWEKVDPGGIYISFCLRCVVHSFQLYHFTCRVGVTGLTN